MFHIILQYVDVSDLNRCLLHVVNLNPKMKLFIKSQSILPSAEKPGVDVNCSTSIILTAYCLSPALFVQRRTTLNGPLRRRKKK
jgi:hypothetical protein